MAISATGDANFRAWLNQPADERSAGQPLITWLAFHLHQLRPDLQHTFPNIFDHDRWAFAEWFAGSAGSDHQLDYDWFVKPVADSLEQARRDQLVQNRGCPYFLFRKPMIFY